MTHLCLMMANAASGHDRERAKRAASTYAASLAWTEADVDIQEIPPGFRLLDEDGAPAVFKTQLSSLGAGDDLLVTSLASISINPHHIQKFIDTLLGKGANLAHPADRQCPQPRDRSPRWPRSREALVFAGRKNRAGGRRARGASMG